MAVSFQSIFVHLNNLITLAYPPLYFFSAFGVPLPCLPPAPSSSALQMLPHFPYCFVFLSFNNHHSPISALETSCEPSRAVSVVEAFAGHAGALLYKARETPHPRRCRSAVHSPSKSVSVRPATRPVGYPRRTSPAHTRIILQVPRVKFKSKRPTSLVKMCTQTRDPATIARCNCETLTSINNDTLPEFTHFVEPLTCLPMYLMLISSH